MRTGVAQDIRSRTEMKGDELIEAVIHDIENIIPVK